MPLWNVCNSMRVEKFIQFNPKIQLKKGTKAKKVDMDKLVPFTRKITGYIEADFTGGSKFINGDTLLARITPCLENGKTAYVNVLEDKEVGFGSTEFIVLRAIEGISIPLFIYYLAVSPDFREIAIASMSGTSGRQRVDVKALEQLEINLPPLEEQKRIAEVLGAFDDKIELLQKQNKTLEDMAKALFKSWFVDFDVVRAKQKGLPKADIMREYHLTDELYDLFPSNFADSPLGPIPSGWEVKPLGAFFPIRTGKKDANVASKEGAYPFFSCAQNVLWTNEYSFDETALLLAGNGDFNLKWYRGKFEAYQRTYVLIPNEKQDLPFLYYAMQFFLDKITLGSRGSVIKFITKGMIANYKLVIPEMHLWKSTGLLLGQWLDKIEMNNKEIQTLTELRDTLLPRLISGKIRV